MKTQAATDDLNKVQIVLKQLHQQFIAVVKHGRDTAAFVLSIRSLPIEITPRFIRLSVNARCACARVLGLILRIVDCRQDGLAVR